MLPANLPITISACNGQTLTVAPAPSEPPLALNFEEKVHDSDSASNFEYNANPFSSALTFPISSAAARIDIEVDNAITITLGLPDAFANFAGIVATFKFAVAIAYLSFALVLEFR